MEFSVPANHRTKLKECKKKEKYLDLTRELKRLWNMKVTVIPIVISAFGTVTKIFIKGTGGLEGWKTNEDYPYYSMNENSPGT